MKTGEAGVSMSESWRIYAITAAICLAVTGVAFLLGVAPAMRQIAQQRAQKSEFLEKKSTASNLAISLAAANQNLKQVQQALDEIPLQLHPMTYLNKQLAQITALATSSGLTLHETQPGQPTATRFHTLVPIQMSGTCDYPTYAHFLHGLHEQFPHTAVSSFRLTTSDNASKPLAMFRMNLIWHATPTTRR